MRVLKPFRLACRLFLSGGLFLTAYLDNLFLIQLRGKGNSFPERARWMRKWAIRLAKICHVRLRVQGTPPTRGIMVSNHLSYLDIVVLGAITPLVFLSKSEVASWPVLGVLTRGAGTLYVVRDQKSDVLRLGEEMVKVVDSGMLVTLFLEGTSSDGSEVLPFRSSLLAAAEKHDWPRTGAWIHYELKEGSVADEVCYWRDMTFFPHFLNLLTKKEIFATVVFGTTLTGKANRKEMARELHAQVCELKRGHLGKERVKG